MALYASSFIGDLFDGIVARKLHQCSMFGSFLDMITDRCSTLGLLFVLYGHYGTPEEEKNCIMQTFFMSVAILDISSHWCQMYSTALLQNHHKSKEGNISHSLIVRWYYENSLIFGYCCIAAEFTYISLYLIYHSHKSGGSLKGFCTNVLILCIPGCAIKQVINIFQLCSACYVIANIDVTIWVKNK